MVVLFSKMSQAKIGSWMYHQIQINGERITTNLSFKTALTIDRNPKEVFVKSIPFTMFEEDLIPLFETIGVVAQLRLMMDYSGRNRGFGYLIFVDCKNGERAIAELNNLIVSSRGRVERLRLSVSKNIRKLWLGNISRELDFDTIIEMIVEKVDPEEISTSIRNGRISYFIKFLTHREAAISRKLLRREILDFGPSAWTNWDLQKS